eukprot:m.328564 g.328564  ORF g.328564 m.328564 type:complete len:363 (+) comp20433_c0_seq2:248-1336(+)
MRLLQKNLPIVVVQKKEVYTKMQCTSSRLGCGCVIIGFILLVIKTRDAVEVPSILEARKQFEDMYGKTARAIQKSRKMKKLEKDWRYLKSTGSLLLYYRLVMWESLRSNNAIDLVHVGDELENYVNNKIYERKSSVTVVIMDDYYQSCDASAYNYRNFSYAPSIRQVFAEDWISIETTDKVTLLPIGINSLSIHDEEQLLAISRTLPPPSQRIPLSILCTAHLGRYAHPKSGLEDDRSQMFESLDGFEMIDFLQARMNKFELWRLHKRFAFELCPEGNGVDTFRFYEAVALRTVPIVRRNSLEPLYRQFGAVIVDSWDDVKNLLRNKTFTTQALATFEKNYDEIFYKLSSEFWLNLIIGSIK